MGENIKRTILCVDDEEDIVNSLFDTFMDVYDVKTATSGADALKLFETEDIALIITDQRMPQMEGTQLLEKIQGIKPICKKILLTGYADINAAVDAINMGSVDKYFSKPWEEDDLLKSVEDLLAEYSMDEFFDKALNDAKGMKEEAKDAKIYKDFLDNYLGGVCITDDDGKISYMNKKGLSLLKCSSFEAIKGKDCKDMFLINELNKKTALEKFMKKELIFNDLDIRSNDGSEDKLKVSITFKNSEEKGVVVNGIVFNK